MFNVGDLVKCKELPYFLFVVVKVFDNNCQVISPEDGKKRKFFKHWLSKIKTDIFCP